MKQQTAKRTMWNKKWATISEKGLNGVISLNYRNRGSQTRDIKIVDMKTLCTYNFKYRKFTKAINKKYGVKL